jgi:hypothetical protein
MDPGPLVREQIDAGARFLTEFEKIVPVGAAFWLRGQDQDSWYLYAAPDRLEDEGRRVVAREVLRVVLSMRDPNLGPLDVRLIKPGEPLAKAALDYQRLYPGKVVHLHDRVFGNIGVDEVYIYPSTIPAA